MPINKELFFSLNFQLVLNHQLCDTVSMSLVRPAPCQEGNQ